MRPTAEIVVYTAATMNGWKPLIFLEEAGIPYELKPIDFAAKQQKAEWFVKLNPNGRIPVVVDSSNNDHVVFESCAILWYLAEKYDRFIPKDAALKSECLQWLFFQAAGLGPMMGQAMYFQRIAAPQGHDDAFATTRYVTESRRLVEVLDARLAGREWLVGDDYSIADMAAYPWARAHFWAKLDVSGLDNLARWFERIDARPATQRALELPKPVPGFFGKGDVAAEQAANAARFKQDVLLKGEAPSSAAPSSAKE